MIGMWRFVIQVSGWVKSATSSKAIIAGNKAKSIYDAVVTAGGTGP